MSFNINSQFDIEAHRAKYNQYLSKSFDSPTPEDIDLLKPVIIKSIDAANIRSHLKKFKTQKYYKNSFLIQVVYALYSNGDISKEEEKKLVDMLRIKRGKSHSGIISVTIFTSPYPSYTDNNGNLKTQSFSCQFDCHFCPNESDQSGKSQPRSYLFSEPGVLRANKHNFDPCDQLWHRMESLYKIGHQIDKIECLVLGGTWTSYPVPYRDQFIRDTYYAANTYYDWMKSRTSTLQTTTLRERGSLWEEVNINKTAGCRIIGLTLETRPDTITAQELRRLRSYGCTRVQLGVQHLDNDVLKANNRGCTTERFVKALRVLKDSCFKVDIHIMPNLYGSTPEKDRHMLLNRFLGMKQLPQVEQRTMTIPFDGDSKHETINIRYETYDINEPDISADQWKLYPCETVAYTELEKLFREGKYIPYDKDELFQILYDTKCNMFPWIRTNRIIRDISSGYIIASSNEPNTGDYILRKLKEKGDTCMCIRCREVKRQEWDGSYQFVIREYQASGGREFFISAESNDCKTLYGFCRLRLRVAEECVCVFEELERCALIRELHVYGRLNMVGEHTNSRVQHNGLGKKLVKTAETISSMNGYKKIAVIAGVGVMKYYEEKLGYAETGNFMTKTITI